MVMARKSYLFCPQIGIRINQQDLLFDAADSSTLQSSYHESVTSTDDIPASVNA